MIRYMRQPTKYTCGPIAILNARKWAGQHATLKDLKRLDHLYRVTHNKGMSIVDLEVALEFECGIKSSCIRSSSRRVYDQLLKAGKVAIIVTSKHYFLLIGRNEDGYVTINLRKERTQHTIKWHTLKRLLTERLKLYPKWPCAFVLERV